VWSLYHGFLIFLCRSFYYRSLISLCIVLRPGSVQSPGSGFWPCHRVGRVNSFFLNQNDIVLVKKKVNGFATGSWPGQLGRWVTLSFSFPCFFFNSVRFQPRVPGQSAEPGRVSKLCLYVCHLSWISPPGFSIITHDN
jgi:hypothetical protein